MFYNMEAYVLSYLLLRKPYVSLTISHTKMYVHFQKIIRRVMVMTK